MDWGTARGGKNDQLAFLKRESARTLAHTQTLKHTKRRKRVKQKAGGTHMNKKHPK